MVSGTTNCLTKNRNQVFIFLYIILILEKQCKKSVFLLHGYIRSNNRLYNHEPKHLGDVLTFTCSKGYVLDGPKSIECQSESRSESILEWSPRPPQCITYRKCRSQGMIVSKNSMYCEQSKPNLFTFFLLQMGFMWCRAI